MRDFGLISTTVWQSERFSALEALDTRLAYLWLHTSAKTCAGVMRVGPAHLFEEVDFVDSLDRAVQVFSEMSEAELIDWIRPYVVIKKYLSFNPVKSYKHAIGAFKEVLAMPDCTEKTALVCELQKQKGAMDLANWRNKAGDPHDVMFDIYGHLSEHSDPIDTLSEPILNPSGISRSKNRKEKGERRSGAEDRDQVVEAAGQSLSGNVEGLRKGEDVEDNSQQGPSESLKRSALVVEMREAG